MLSFHDKPRRISSELAQLFIPFLLKEPHFLSIDSEGVFDINYLSGPRVQGTGAKVF